MTYLECKAAAGWQCFKLLSPRRAGGGMCCCPNGTLRAGLSSTAPQTPLQTSTLLLAQPACIGGALNVLPARWIPCHAGPELGKLRGERFLRGVPSCSAVTKGIMCSNRLLVFYPPPTCVTSGCWRQMAQCSLDLSVGWEKLTLTKEIPWSFEELICVSLK